MSQPRAVLYLSFDGLLESLGTSQVVRPVCGLSDRRAGRFTVLSLEKPSDLMDVRRVNAMESWLASHGVRWVRARHAGGARGAVLNLSQMLARASLEVRRQGISLVHARSHLAGLVALGLRQMLGVPYLFDFRGYWIDERLDEGRWFTTKRRLRVARALESKVFREAAGIVSLTALGADDIRSGRFGQGTTQLIAVIPTCVDEHDFTLSSEARLPPDVQRRLEGKLVLGYVGSLNVSYNLDAALALFRNVRARCSNAHLLCVSRQQAELRARVLRSGIAEADVTLTGVEHAQMPAVMNALDWGFLILNESPAKRASMPTKLAEFLASGVRPIQFGCNSEVGEWVRRTGSGVCLAGLEPSALSAAAESIGRPREADELTVARERMLSHFGLTECLGRYERLYADLTPPGAC